MDERWLLRAAVGVLVTVLFYGAALRVQRRWPWAHPLVLTAGALIGVIGLLQGWMPMGDWLNKYEEGGAALKFVLGPATVALAVPLYRRIHEIRAQLPAVLGAVIVGGTVSVAVSWALTTAWGGTSDVRLAMLSRSVTTPISIGIARQLGAPQELAATFTVLSGLLGAVIGPAFLRAIGIRRDLPAGLAIGTAAHGIGTSSVIRHSQAQGAAAGLAMALNGVFTSVLMIPLYLYLGR